MQNDLKDNMEITNKLLLEMVKNQKAANKNLTKVFMSAIIGYTVLVLAMIAGFFIYESQYETTEEERLSIEQEVSGEEAEINNVLGNMYKDNATHNEEKQ
jgi:hypothetical protein